MLQILHLNAFDAAGGGGAARAAYRIHCCLEQYGSDEGIRSLLRVLDKRTDDQTVIGGPTPSSNHWLWRRVNPRRYLRAKRSFNSALPTLHSIAWPASGLAHELVNGRLLGDYDVLNLHWLGDHMLSIEEIGALQKPVVWTLHDQWPFCGAEHYADPLGSLLNEGSEERYVLGYPSWSRPPSESGPDLNRLTWLRKKRCWIQPITIVSPSTWLAGCAKRSFLMQHWPITVIPHPIDLNVWSPIERQLARQVLGLKPDIPIVLFGAIDALADQRKGADLLLASLQKLGSRNCVNVLENLEIIIFGQSRPRSSHGVRFPVRYFDRLHDDISLQLLYSAADVMIVPSRQEAFGQTASEAHACGTPVVAFRTSGLCDIVEDRITGALAEPFDPESLASAIQWVLEDPIRCRALGAAARARAVRLWDPQRIAGLYADVYRQALLTRPH